MQMQAAPTSSYGNVFNHHQHLFFCLFLCLLHKLFEPSSAHLRRLVWHTGHRARRVVLASGPQVTADLRGFAKGHADAGGAEEGIGGTVVFAEVEVHVGAWEVVMSVCFTKDEGKEKGKEKWGEEGGPAKLVS